jgi:hypothetical protein
MFVVHIRSARPELEELVMDSFLRSSSGSLFAEGLVEQPVSNEVANSELCYTPTVLGRFPP